MTSLKIIQTNTKIIQATKKQIIITFVFSVYYSAVIKYSIKMLIFNSSKCQLCKYKIRGIVGFQKKRS